jgi:hypothetical protein
VDKYARAAHPDISGYSGRTRIKQRFAPLGNALTAWFPPKWGINVLDWAGLVRVMTDAVHLRRH